MTRSLGEWLNHIEGVHPSSIEMGLERVTQVAQRLDVTKPAQQTVIVAGTNGKGSTSVALERLLLGSGRRVGTTLSPHLIRFNERIRVDGAELGDAAICELFRAVDAARGDILLTYFEYSALAALLAFKQARVDVAILEVGLGGRLDAFNLVDADLAIVTSIGLDHEDYLGHDIERIGREKAGVFRPGRPVVLGAAVTESVAQAALELGSPSYRLGSDFFIVENGTSWGYHSERLGMRFAEMTRGPLAPANCALAVTAAALLLDQPVTDAAMLSEIELPGRMVVHEHQNGRLIVDVAHNPAAAAFLAEQLGYRCPDQQFVALFGSLKDKDAVGVVAALDCQVSHWLTVDTQGPRGQTADALAKRIDSTARAPVEASDSVDGALERALSLTGSGGGILALGSFSVVEQVTTLLAEWLETPS